MMQRSLKKLSFFILPLWLGGCFPYPPGSAGSFSPGNQAAQCHPKQGDYRRAVVRINSPSGITASGVVIANNRVITAAHAVRHGSPVYVGVDEQAFEAKILVMDVASDLAYLSVNTQKITPLLLAGHDLVHGEPVWATSYPLASDQRVSTGFFEAVNNGRLYTTVHINSGSSGGGLFRCEGGTVKLAGIMHGFVALERGGNLINIGDSTAVSALQIKRLVKQYSAQSSEKKSQITWLQTTGPAL